MPIIPNQRGPGGVSTRINQTQKGGTKLLQQLINVHTALSIRQSFILLILCKGQQQKYISMKIERNPKNRRQ